MGNLQLRTDFPGDVVITRAWQAVGEGFQGQVPPQGDGEDRARIETATQGQQIGGAGISKAWQEAHEDRFQGGRLVLHFGIEVELEPGFFPERPGGGVVFVQNTGGALPHPGVDRILAEGEAGGEKTAERGVAEARVRHLGERVFKKGQLRFQPVEQGAAAEMIDTEPEQFPLPHRVPIGPVQPLERTLDSVAAQLAPELVGCGLSAQQGAGVDEIPVEQISLSLEVLPARSARTLRKPVRGMLFQGRVHSRPRHSASRSRAALAKAHMFSSRRSLPVARVTAFSSGPETAMQECPGGSP